MTERRAGIALITTLSMMVVLLTIVGFLTMLTVSDLRQSRSSVQQMQARAIAEAGEVYARYAASSAAQDEMRSELRSLMNVNVNPAAQWVIPQSRWAEAQSRVQAILNTTYNQVSSSDLDDVGAATIEYSLNNFRGGLQSASSQTYLVDYTVLSTGSASGATRRVEDRGVYEIQIGKPSLSQYLFLVHDAGGESGFFPTGSRFNGPVHANYNWGFWGSPEFLDTITTADDSAIYYNAGNQCSGAYRTRIQGDSRPPCTVPVFAKGFTRNAPFVELPESSLSQQRAALGLDPESTAGVTQRMRCQILQVRPNCNSNSSVPNGIYVVNDGSSITGGIYVQGDLDELLLDGSSRDGVQVYVFEQGSTTVTMEVDHNANTTTVTRATISGTTEVTYAGVPNGPAPLGSGGATGQIYVTGRIDELSGPGRSGYIGSDPPDHPVPDEILPALARETELNITAEQRIDLTSDLVYECDPTAVSDPAYVARYPRCDAAGTVLPTVLGVMSIDDDIRITTETPDDLYLWGSLLAGDNGNGLSVQNHSSRGAQGTLRLFGGVIQYEDQFRGVIYTNGNLASGYIETFDYDQRFANGSVAPPNFPTVRTFDVQQVIPVALTFREF